MEEVFNLAKQHGIPVLDEEVTEETLDEQAKKLIKLCRPNRQDSTLKVERLSSGVVNKNYHVQAKGFQDDVIIRLINQVIPQSYYDTVRAMLYMKTLNLGPRINVLFRNGLGMDFIEGQGLNLQTHMRVKEPVIWRNIARKMAEIHGKASTEDAEKFGVPRQRTLSDVLIQLTQRALSKNLVPEEVLATYPTMEQVLKGRDDVEAKLDSMNAEVGVCHYDVNPTNIIIRPNGTDVEFVDFEFFCISYQAQDIAWFFMTCVDLRNPTFDDYPIEEEQAVFLHEYLTARFEIEKKDPYTDEDMKHWDIMVKRSKLLKMIQYVCISIALLETSSRQEDLNTELMVFQHAQNCWVEYQKNYDEYMNM